jgi:hypothetical protein
MLHNIINDPFKVGRSGTARRLANRKPHQINITARKLHELSTSSEFCMVTSIDFASAAINVADANQFEKWHRFNNTKPTGAQQI